MVRKSGVVWFLFGLAVVVGLMVWMQFMDFSVWGRRFAWSGFMLALIACFRGLAILSTERGSLLVGHNGTFSLSHFVTLAWSTLILGALLVVLALRLNAVDVGNTPLDLDTLDPLNLRVDESLVYVMVATVGSFAGAKAIASQRTKTHPEAVARDLLSNQAPGLVEELRRSKNVPKEKAQALVRSMAEQMGKHNSFASVRAHPERLAWDAGLLKGRPSQAVADAEARHAQEAAEFLYGKAVAEVQRRTRPKDPSPSVRDFVSRQSDHGPALELGKTQWAVISLVAMIAFVFTFWALLGVGPGCNTADCFPGLPALPSGVAGILVASGGGYVGSKIGS